MTTHHRPDHYLWSFGKLIRRMRGKASLTTLAALTQLDASELEQVEAGAPVTELTGRIILKRGFKLNKADSDRLILGLKLYDAGLHDNDIRQLVIDWMSDTMPSRTRAALRRLYRSYAGAATTPSLTS